MIQRSFSLAIAAATLVVVSSPFVPATTGTPALHGQASAVTFQASVPVTVALVEQLPRLSKEYAAAVLRRSDGLDIILLPRETASAELLDAAMRTLVHARAVQGAQPRTHRGKAFDVMTLGVRPVRAAPAWTERYLQRAQVVVDSLRAAPRVPVRGVGAVPAVEIYAPSLRP